jgi:ADP-heptose:LPS heptosyltransferase
VDAYLEFLTPLDVRATDKTYEYPIGHHEIARAQFALGESGINAARRLAVIHPGGKLHVNSRRWPAEYFARVCEYLYNEGFEVVLTGDHSDGPVCAEVARACQAEITSLAGALNFSESAALLSIADLVITNDTATLHLAEAAAAAQVVSIFGPTDPSLLAPVIRGTWSSDQICRARRAWAARSMQTLSVAGATSRKSASGKQRLIK